MLNVSASPHIHSGESTRRIMLDVLIALSPALIAAIFNYGFRALLVTAVCVISAVFFEWGFNKLCKKPCTIGDLSAAVTGTILAFNLPVSIPLWQAAFGSLVAIVVVKGLFGGLGKNFANPAITGRIAMFLSFSNTMSDWTYKPLLSADVISSATPLAMIQAGEKVRILDLLLGMHGGCIGETCILALLLGFAYLLRRRVITWHTPVVYIGTVFVLSLIFGHNPILQILSGGLFLSAIFMATDYVTTPTTAWGKVIFGLGCGLLTILIRLFGSYSEGVSFAVLFMNILTPYISKWTETKPFGGMKA